MMKATVTYNGAGFRAYMNRVPKAAEEGPAEAAEYLAEQWRGGVAVETGSYRDGIYTQTHDRSGYAAAVAKAKADNPTVEIRPELPKPSRKGAAAVGSAAGHDVFNEFGTVNMPAHPAYVPAVEATRRRFPEIMRRKLQP